MIQTGRTAQARDVLQRALATSPKDWDEIAVRLNIARLEGNAVVAVAVIQPPGLVEQPVLRPQPFVKGGSRERSQVVEGGALNRSVEK
jgi:hypothetical protein